MATSIELSPDNPWRPADWRWQRATRIAAGELRANRKFDDEHVTRAVRLARAVTDETSATGTGQNVLANSDPTLFWAYNLKNTIAPAMRAEVEARVLAGDSDDEIRSRTGTTLGTLRTYEQLFFDVRDRLGCSAYVLHIVLGDELHRGSMSEKNYALLWKFFGYTYGPRMLDAIIGQAVAPYRPRTGAETKGALQDIGVGGMLRKQALSALTVPVNTFTQIDILQVYSKFVEIDRANGQARASMQPDSLLANIEAVLAVLPMDVGAFANLRVDSATLSKYDAGAGELNCRQLMLASQDLLPTDATDFDDLTYPEVNNHVQAQQGSGAEDLPGVG